MKKIKITAGILFLVFLSACLPTVEVTKSWKNDEELKKREGGKSVFIIALTDNMKAKKKVEGDLAAAAKKRGITAVKSSEVFTSVDPGVIDHEAVVKKAKETGSSAIFTVALLKEENETYYRSGDQIATAPVTRLPYFGSFDKYYSRMYSSVMVTGYYTTQKVYYMESNLFDTKTQKLLWFAQSETYDPMGLSEASNNFTKAMIRQLEKDGILKK